MAEARNIKVKLIVDTSEAVKAIAELKAALDDLKPTVIREDDDE